MRTTPPWQGLLFLIGIFAILFVFSHASFVAPLDYLTVAGGIAAYLVLSELFAIVFRLPAIVRIRRPVFYVSGLIVLATIETFLIQPLLHTSPLSDHLARVMDDSFFFAFLMAMINAPDRQPNQEGAGEAQPEK